MTITKKEKLFEKLRICIHPANDTVLVAMGDIRETCCHKCGKTIERYEGQKRVL